MKLSDISLKSLSYYLRSNFWIALGVAAATAVLTGALIVGDSMRQSLRSLTMDRLGKIDEMLTSEGFFREKLADEIKQTPTFKEHYSEAVPAILFPGGTVQYQPEDVASRAGQVAVFGIDGDFWKFDNRDQSEAPLFGRDDGQVAVINDVLANDLGVTAADVKSGKAVITVRIPKQTQLPADSALGRKTDLIESLVDLKVLGILPTEGLARFSLFPSQSDPLNVFVPIGLLQEALEQTVLKHKSDPAQANCILLSSKNSKPPGEAVSKALRNEIRPTLEDYGLNLKRVTQTFGEGEELKTIYDYWSLSSDKMVLSDETVASIGKTFGENEKSVFTYLANDIKKSNQVSGVPFSMVSAIDLDSSFPIRSIDGEVIAPLDENEIVINEWTAKDLGAQVGDRIKVTYFEPETTHGSQVEGKAEFELVAIASLTEPIEPFNVPRRGPMELPIYREPPTIANDFNLTPEVPGVTDAQSIEKWDLPFETADKLRPQDDDYWTFYRTTPKAFISFAAGQKLWNSRFGKTTSIRIASKAFPDSSEVEKRLLDQLASDEVKLGMHLVPLKRRGLAASSGSTPFDVLFLALSMFVIGSALILVSLLFRLSLQQRASELGVFKATGFSPLVIRKLWSREMAFVSLFGAIVGICLGVGYAWLMIKGLTTWWVGAISKPFLQMHVSPISLAIGCIVGVLVCLLTIGLSLRRTRREPVRSLLAGQLESRDSFTDSKTRFAWIPPVLVVVGIGLAFMAIKLSGEAQAGAFMGSGFLVLVALLMTVYFWLKKPEDSEVELGLSKLALMSAKRNPLRSTLTIGLVAVASFLIAAVSAFRLAPTGKRYSRI